MGCRGERDSHFTYLYKHSITHIHISITYLCLDRQRCFTGRGWARELSAASWRKTEGQVADCHNVQPPAVFLSRTLSCCQMAGFVVIDWAALVQLATWASRRRDHKQGYKGNTSGEVRLRVDARICGCGFRPW